MLSPEQQADVVEVAAQRLVEHLLSGGVGDDLICIPLATAAQFAGLSTQTARKTLPITELSDGKHAVTLANLRAFLAQRTTYPKGWVTPQPEAPPAPAVAAFPPPSPPTPSAAAGASFP